MIGDGMSLMHVYSAWTANRGKLFLDNCQAVGLSKTYCADKLITDSGAGGTAIASGQKTNYHYVGVDTLGHPLKSLVDFAAAKGKSTGIAVTCRLWDATPADFCPLAIAVPPAPESVMRTMYLVGVPNSLKIARMDVICSRSYVKKVSGLPVVGMNWQV